MCSIAIEGVLSRAWCPPLSCPGHAHALLQWQQSWVQQGIKDPSMGLPALPGSILAELGSSTAGRVFLCHVLSCGACCIWVKTRGPA